jgi:hypothetical protein
MNFLIDCVSFYLIEQQEEENGPKRVRLGRTLSGEEYQQSELRPFLEGEFSRIAKRKAEQHPRSEGSPTKLGQFVIEEGFTLDSNPNYALFQRARQAATPDEFAAACEPFVQSYLRTSQVRSGVLLFVKAVLERYEDRFLFILKCDFEQKTAVITDEKSLIANVNMAINAKNMKSILYPHLIEPGMVDEYHVKIHQFSHARYFEEFLKYIQYPETASEIVSREVVSLARQYIEQTFPDEPEERQREEEAVELMAASPKRTLAEKWDHETVMEAAQIIAESQPQLELKLKLDHMSVKTLLADYGTQIHIAKSNGRYLILLEGEMLEFERGVSPVEFLKPKQLHEIVRELEQRSQTAAAAERPIDEPEDSPPW